MSKELDTESYDSFLDRFEDEESSISAYASLEPNLFEPLVQERLINSLVYGEGDVPREAYQSGPNKHISEDEFDLRNFEFFKKKQRTWSKSFYEMLKAEGIAVKKIDAYIHAFATEWVDGHKRRHKSPEIQAIKASIKQHDAAYSRNADKYILNKADVGDAEPLLQPWEMAAVFEINSRLLDTCIQDYFDVMHNSASYSVNRLYVRRGVYMRDAPKKIMTELNYLNSYSLAVTLPEIFAQTYSPGDAGKGVATIFSTSLPNVQNRIVAFAPFIKKMAIGQLELVIAPPLRAMDIESHGTFGTSFPIAEYSYH